MTAWLLAATYYGEILTCCIVHNEVAQRRASLLTSWCLASSPKTVAATCTALTWDANEECGEGEEGQAVGLEMVKDTHIFISFNEGGYHKRYFKTGTFC